MKTFKEFIIEKGFDSDDIAMMYVDVLIRLGDEYMQYAIDIMSKEVPNHWYNELHGKFNPITQKQKLTEFIKNFKTSV